MMRITATIIIAVTLATITGGIIVKAQGNYAYTINPCGSC